MNSLGDAWVDIHGDADPFARDAERGVREGAKDAEDEAAEAGEDLGETLSKAMGKRLRESGPDLAREVERGLGRQKIRTKVTVQFDKEGNVVRRWVSTITDEISDAFKDTDSRGPGGIFRRLQTGIADAIGAGFNVSGRSPLIALLVPAVGAIIGLVIGAIQAVNALVAVLVTVPALIASIGIQVGIVALAFDGMGEAIQGAFSAKNSKELHEALKDLTPAAQNFVHNILPLKDVFKELRAFVQENFFVGLGNLFGTGGPLQPLLGTVGGLGPVAHDLGEFFGQIARALGSPSVIRFVEMVLPAISRFLDRFGPSLEKFIIGLNDLSITALPFFERLGSHLSSTISMIGELFTNVSKDPATGTWLDQMDKTLLSIWLLTQSVIVFLKTLMEQLDKAGAREVIDTFTEALDRLTFFLSTPLGQKGLEGLINLAIISIKVLTGLMVLILLVLAAFQYAAEAISAFFTWVWDGIQSLWDKIIGLFTDADDQIIAALGNVDTMLFNVGARIIKGLIAGIRSMVPSLGGVMTIIASTITRYLPHSPAEEGPLSGSGDLMVAGKNIIDRLSAGITAGSQELGVAMTGATNNIVFGANAIQVGFNGALPTEAQAMQTGMAVGQGALSILARNTRLAVRTA
jgi:hypothetical protein